MQHRRFQYWLGGLPPLVVGSTGLQLHFDQQRIVRQHFQEIRSDLQRLRQGLQILFRIKPYWLQLLIST